MTDSDVKGITKLVTYISKRVLHFDLSPEDLEDVVQAALIRMFKECVRRERTFPQLGSGLRYVSAKHAIIDLMRKTPGWIQNSKTRLCIVGRADDLQKMHNLDSLGTGGSETFSPVNPEPVPVWDYLTPYIVDAHPRSMDCQRSVEEEVESQDMLEYYHARIRRATERSYINQHSSRVFSMLANGFTVKEIAAKLKVTVTYCEYIRDSQIKPVIDAAYTSQVSR